jgi:hypothetical protein
MTSYRRKNIFSGYNPINETKIATISVISKKNRIFAKRKKLISMNSNTNGEYRFAIEYYIFREGENIIAYCPSLDISTSGKDYSDAVKNFYERFQIYIETSLEMGTLWDDLKDHGWKVTEKKLTPPPFSRLVRKPEVSKLLGGHINYEKVSAPMRIAAMA